MTFKTNFEIRNCPKWHEPDINKSYFSSFRFGNFGNCQVPRQCLLGQRYPRESLGSLWWQECRNLRICFVEVQVLRPLWWPQWWEHCWPQDPRKVILCIIMKIIKAIEGLGIPSNVMGYDFYWNVWCESRVATILYLISLIP